MEDLIKKYLIKTQQRQMTKAEIMFVIQNIQWPCELVVFGAGYDTLIWKKLNKGGKTVILENDEKWIRKGITKVEYWTKYEDFLEDYGKEDLILDLPFTPDYIIVDGPFGFHHGRTQSISTARKYWELGSKVFIHDCHRELEMHYCDNLWKTPYQGVHHMRFYDTIT
jgi:ribosomal protein L30/L7E